MIPVRRPQATAVREIAEFSTRPGVPFIAGSGIMNIDPVVKTLSMNFWATMMNGFHAGAEVSSRESCRSDGRRVTRTVRQAQ
jgi:IMP dehydrogenase